MTSQTANTFSQSILGDLVEEVFSRLERGEELDIEKLALDYPEHKERLSQLLPMLCDLNALELSFNTNTSVDEQLRTAEQRTLGDFRLLRQLGRGGMGVVYEAQQLTINRKVALKILPLAALVDSRAIKRFKNEVAAIATLEHPHIVSVYAVGEERGIHYYAMQLIRGQSLAAVIQELRAKARNQESITGDLISHLVLDMEKNSSEGRSGKRVLTAISDPREDGNDKQSKIAIETQARGRSTTNASRITDQTYYRNIVRLILQAADALQHAHDHGIVHRDVKPGNLMLDTHGSLFVTDFGLARIEAGAGVTMTGDVMGTLRYMSPEQVLGNRVIIDHRTDVYSLGATLYELLTLQAIWSGENKAELIRQISFEEPTHPKKINPSIPTDLETIVLKAISKNPNDRYDNAQAFANDLSCFLDHKSIFAKRPTVVQRINKWTRRNPAIMWSTIAVLIVAIVGLTIGSLMIARERTATETALGDAQREKVRAQQRELEAIEAVRLFGDSVANNIDLKNLPELETLRITLLQEPLTFFKSLRERLSADADTSPESVQHLAKAAFDLGKLSNEIGDKQNALTAFQDAQAFLKSLARDNVNNAAYQSDLARSHAVIGSLLSETGKSDDALLAYQQALEIRQRLSEAHPHVALYQSDLAWSHNELGSLLSQTGKADLALTAQQRALEIRQALVRANADVAEYQRNLANSHFDLGSLLSETGKPNEALVAYQQALEIRQRLTQANPSVALYQRDLAGSYSAFGKLLHETGKPQEALAAYQQAVGIQDRLVRANPSVTLYKDWLATSLHNQGNLLKEMRKPDRALVAYQQSQEISERLAQANPSVSRYKIKLADGYSCIGNLCHDSGKAEQALVAYRQALKIHEGLAQENASLTDARNSLAIIHNSIGIVLFQMEKPDQALDAWQQSLEIRKELARDNPKNADFQSSVGGTLSNMATIDGDARRYSEAADKLTSAIDYQKRALAANPNHPQYKEFLYNHHCNLLYVRSLDATALSPEANGTLHDWSRSEDGTLNEEYANFLNEVVWGSAKTPATADQPKITASDLAEMRLVAAQFPKSMFANTLGTAEYRAGNYEAAIIACSRSMELARDEQNLPGPDPSDLAILAMSHQQLGHTDEANKFRSQFDEAMIDAQFKNNAECQSFAKEVATAFAEKP